MGLSRVSLCLVVGLPTTLCAQTVQPLPQRLPDLRTFTQAVTAGDVDQDGDVDLLLGCDGQNRLYRNDGRGFFGDATSRIPTDADVTVDVAFGDVDDDGDMDAVLANKLGGNQQNRLYRNDGSGQFSDATGQLPVASDDTAAAALADVDGDGDLDLLFGNGDETDPPGAQNRLYLNDGLGSFSDATGHLPAVVDSTTDLAVEDVDGDGDRDMFVVNGGLDGVERLFLNDGNGVFSDATAQIPADGTIHERLALADVDGDGDRDAFLVGGVTGGFFFSTPNTLFLNDGNGVFSDAPFPLPQELYAKSAITLEDVDGDGDLDALLGTLPNCQFFGPCLGGFPLLYLNDGSGVFTSATNQLPRPYFAYTYGLVPTVALVDVDGDGDRDAFIAQSGPGMQDSLLTNDGQGLFRPETTPLLQSSFDLLGGRRALRNCPPNKERLAAGIPRMGEQLLLDVNNAGTGSTFAAVLGFLTPLKAPFNGQWLLVNLADPAGELLFLPAKAGAARVDFMVLMPTDPAFCGLTFSVQGFGFGGGGGVRAYNAFDMELGAGATQCP